MRKVFLDDLPRREGKSNQIDWKKSINKVVQFIYDDIEGKVEIVDYKSKGQYLYIKYQDKEIFKIHTNSFKNCCIGKLLDKIFNEFKIKIGQAFKDNKRDLIIVDREYRIKKSKDGYNETRKWYKYKCNKCGWMEGFIQEYDLLIGVGCSCCAGIVVVEGINDICTTAPEIVKFFKNPEEAKLHTKSSHKKIDAICPNCGIEKQNKVTIKNLYKYKSISCSCGDGISYPNKFMYNILEQLKINFKFEYSPEWIKPKRYDFYFELDDNKYIVEMDGAWHKVDNLISGISIQENKAIDDYKDKLAQKHDVEVIRIDCELSDLEFIKNNILNSKLIELFNLSRIDWCRVERFALNNRVKEACELKRSDPDITATQIGNIMNIDRRTIRNYLKKGSKLGWCDYDPQSELSKNYKLNSKQVEVFKNNELLGIFNSCAELDRQSEKLFGIKLYSARISAACIGKTESYKGFTFKYI